MSAITTHVLDLSSGEPAKGMGVTLEIYMVDRGWVKLGEKVTDADGRVRDLLKTGAALDPGHYRLTFEVGEYFRARATPRSTPRSRSSSRCATPRSGITCPCS